MNPKEVNLVTENKSEYGNKNFENIVLQFNATKQNGEVQNRPPQQQEPTYRPMNYNDFQRCHSTSTDATFEGAWCNRMISQQGGYSTTPADKQINE